MKYQAKLAGMKLGMALVEAERRAAGEIRRIEAKRRVARRDMVRAQREARPALDKEVGQA